MTHDELLAKVKDNPTTRAVVELHTHVTTGKKRLGKAGLRKRCTECGFAYPCPTIELIIEKCYD